MQAPARHALTDAVRNARERLHAQTHRDGLTAEAVSRLVVVLSPSRGGSSYLFHLLRASGRFAGLAGEHTHLYRTYGIGLPDALDAHDGSIDPRRADAQRFVRALLADSTVGDAWSARATERFAVDVTCRLISQWPSLAPDAESVLAIALRALAARRSAGAPHDTAGPLLGLLAELCRQGAQVNPWYYDIPAEMIRHWFPFLVPPDGPPVACGPLIESPPFIVPRPGLELTADHLQGRPLLVKASIDAYRLDLLRDLFPQADARVIHLVRNPAASINGLLDGWLARGFFSHDLSDRVSLSIAGYSDRPWGARWWNFHLARGWRQVAREPLATVCSFQWRQAHDEILRSLGRSDVPSLRVRFEDLMDDGLRWQTLGAIFRFCGVPIPLAIPDERSVVMATVAPRPGRWRARLDVLHEELERDSVMELAATLGYGRTPTAAWT